MVGVGCSGGGEPREGIGGEDPPLSPQGEALEEALSAGTGWPDDPAGAADGPLSGLRVVDLSRVLAGPFAAMVLGDLGADVIKVERPGAGDDTRAWGPPFFPDDTPPRDAAYFLSVNRNRRSLTVDLSTGAGMAIVRRLVGACEVVIENFLPRQLASLGLDAMRARHPQAVWVSIRGAGGDGPAGELPGYDVMAQARSGLMSITGHPDTGPTKTGVAIADVVAGLYAAISALAGVIGRRSSPAAAQLEVGLLESAISALVNQSANYLIGGMVPRPMGNDHPNLAPYGPVACADADLVVGAGTDGQFAALCAAIGAGELAGDPRFGTNALRVANRDELSAALGAVFSGRSARDWQAALDAAGVPCAPVQSIDEVAEDPHVQKVGLISTVEHALGDIRLVGSPVRVDGQRSAIRRAPPLVGEHTDEILGALGLDAATISQLRDEGVC